jgi:DNA-binding MarR family transcriptional regulator
VNEIGLPFPDRESSLASHDKIELRVWLRLLTCTHLIEGQVRGRLREVFETTLPRFDLLAQLDRAPEGLSMSVLGSRLMVSNGNVTGLIDALVREGLVSREADAGDRRRLRIRLTRSGKAAFDAMTPAHEAWIDRLMSGLSRTEMAQLLQLLGKLKRSVREATA